MEEKVITVEKLSLHNWNHITLQVRSKLRCELTLACRLVGDQLPGYENMNITSLPMIIQPLSSAQNAELQLQIMLTKGEVLMEIRKRE